MGVKKIIQEEIQQTVLDGIIDLLEGVGDKYGEKLGVPDAGAEFEKRWQAHQQTQQKDVENGELVGQVYSTEDYYDDYQQQPINVYKNPVSLKNFQPNVRAVGDRDGNLYVSQIDGNFYHENIIDIVPSITSYSDGVQLYRAGDTNMFGVAGTYLRNIFKTDDVTTAMSQEHIEDHPEIRGTFVKLNNKQPFDFSYYPTYMLRGQLSQQQIDQSILRDPEPGAADKMDYFEGVADKYAEKKWGIPDERAAQERQADKGIKDSSMGEMVGQSVSNYNQGDQSLIYKNPKSLNNFEAGVRAVSDLKGDLYVAQHNGDFVHKGMQDALKTDIYRNDYVITWHRVKSSNIFGYSDSFTGYGLNNREETEGRLEILRKKHPAFRFIPQYYFGIDVNDPDIEFRAEPMEYFEEIVKQEIDNFVEGTGDKYAQKVSGIPDAGEMFDNQYQAHLKSQKQDPSMGEWVLRFDSVQYVKQHGKWVEILVKVNVFKNPKSMNGFPTKVRGISDENGDMYVADVMGDFTHSELGSRIFSGMYDDIYKIQKYVTWYYDKRDAAFSLASVSESAFHRLIGGMYSENIYDRFWNGIRKLKEKNPGYKLEEVDDKLPELKEGVGDKYVEKKFHIPDEETEFEKQWQGELQKNVEKPFKSNGKLDVYKNPSSLKHFDNSVRAIADENGDLYVAQQDLPFSHAELAQFIGLVKEYRDYWFMVEKLPALHRRGNTNTFGLSDSSVKNIKRSEDNRNKVRDIFSKTKQKNPEFDFTLKYYFDEGMAVGDNSGYMQMIDEEIQALEGVGDKYAEKKWGIPDQDKQYQDMGVPDANMGERVTDVWGHRWKDNKNINYGPIYKNPKSLQGFDADARAIALDDGTLYVAQHDGDFIHVDMELALEKVEGPLGEYYEFHRVGTKPEFGASDTLIHKIQDYAVDMRGMIEELERMHPQFEFSDKYYEYLRNSVDEIVEEEIQNIVKEVGEATIQPYQWWNTNEKYMEKTQRGQYNFNTDNDLEYYVFFNRPDLRQPDWRVDFQANDLETGAMHSDTSTNRGEPLKIMSTIADIIKDFVVKMNPQVLNINAAKEGGDDGQRRLNLYQRFVERNLPQEYKVDKVGDKLIVSKNNRAEYFESDHRLMEIMSEEIQNVIKEIQPMEFKKSAQEIADNLQPSEYWTRMKNNNPEYYREQKPVLANVDMKLADEAFQRDHDFYIGPDDRGIGNRKERVLQTIEDGTLKYAPDVSIRMSHYDVPVLSFGDGRHRFAVLRDLGVESINMTFSKESEPHIHLLQKKMGLQEIINEEIQNAKQDVLKQYIEVLKQNRDERYGLAIAYFIILHNFLNLERSFQADVDAAGKPLDKYLDVKPLRDPEAVYKKFLELYDTNSRVRFAVETFDSIEPIRVFLQDHPEYYREVLN